MNQYDPKIHHRRAIRMEDYDYSQEGFYFITICIQKYKCLLGSVSGNNLTINEAGKMVETEWEALPQRFPNIQLHEYISMPNHFHAIIEILHKEEITLVPIHEQSNAKKSKTLFSIIDAFKSITTVKYIHGVKDFDWRRFENKLWQSSYYEHIIRNYESHQKIADYIVNNPVNWKEDKLNI